MNSSLVKFWSRAPVLGNHLAPIPFRGIRTVDLLVSPALLCQRWIEPFREFIDTAYGMEYERNPEARYWYAYFTADQRFVRKSHAHRFSGAHTDGWGAAQHNYAFVTGTPTEFFEGAFEMPDERHGEAVHALEEQVGRRLDLEPGRILSFNSLAVHRSPVSKMNENRTFLRLCFRKELLEVA